MDHHENHDVITHDIDDMRVTCLIIFIALPYIEKYFIKISNAILWVEMPAHCCAVGCKSRQGKLKVKFIRFPANRQLKDRWTAAVKREKWLPMEHSRICSADDRMDEEDESNENNDENS